MIKISLENIIGEKRLYVTPLIMYKWDKHHTYTAGIAWLLWGIVVEIKTTK